MKIHPLVIFLLTGSLVRSQYLNEWTIHLPSGLQAAKEFALEHGLVHLGEVIPDSNLHHFKYPRRFRRSISPSEDVTSKFRDHPEVGDEVDQQVALVRHKRFEELNDPYWDKMWYLNRGDNLDMNVQGAWDQGVTGQGVAVTILDDGIEKDHPDLIRNYDPRASTDINDNDSDPHPRYDFSDSNRHGTRCAGQVTNSKSDLIGQCDN